MFINEVMHPEAESLFDTLIAGPDNYMGLRAWQQHHGLSEEQAAELFAHVEDGFDAKPIHSISRVNAVSIVSRALHLTEAVEA